MIKYTNFTPKAEKAFSAKEQLPVGSYVCKILTAKVEEGKFGQVLVLAFDVAEGEHKDFFKMDYDANMNPDKKWRGSIRINIPTGDGSEADSRTQRVFNGFVWNIEDSNKNFHVGENEKDFIGKMIGISIQRREWEMGDKTGWTNQAGRTESISDVRAGKVRPMADKPLRKKSEEPVYAAPAATSNDDFSDLPF